jgi:branched-chain amino acid transport system permease protein
MSGALARIDWRRGPALALVAAVVLALLPLVVSSYTLHVLAIGLYYTILAACWNLLAGFTGQFSLAQQTFAVIGAYTSGLLIYHFQAPLPLAMASGVLAAAALGFFLGRMVLKMRAIYLAIATWAFAETIHVLLTAAFNITRGELGLHVPSLYGHVEPGAYFYTFLALAVVSIGGMYLLVRSPFGTFMRAIRDDELRAESLGVDTTQVKVVVFTVTSAISGLAGVFYGHYVIVLSPQMADFNEMAKLIVMVVVGGLGSFAGPLVAALPIQWLTTWLQKWGEWDMIVYAVIVIVLMRSYTGGLVALFRDARTRLRRPATAL